MLPIDRPSLKMHDLGSSARDDTDSFTKEKKKKKNNGGKLPRTPQSPVSPTIDNDHWKGDS
jgi:hypothetical protein